MPATIDDFSKLDIRVGQVLHAEEFPEAKKPAYTPTGQKRSSAQMTKHYKISELIGKKVLAVVNLPPRQIGPLLSEVLTLGVPDGDGHVVLIEPENENALIGRKIF